MDDEEYTKSYIDNFGQALALEAQRAQEYNEANNRKLARLTFETSFLQEINSEERSLLWETEDGDSVELKFCSCSEEMETIDISSRKVLLEQLREDMCPPEIIFGPKTLTRFSLRLLIRAKDHFLYYKGRVIDADIIQVGCRHGFYLMFESHDLRAQHHAAGYIIILLESGYYHITVTCKADSPLNTCPSDTLEKIMALINQNKPYTLHIDRLKKIMPPLLNSLRLDDEIGE